MFRPAVGLGSPILFWAVAFSAAATIAAPAESQAGRPDTPEQTLAHFRKFDADTRRSLIRAITRKIKLDPNPAIQRIVSMQRDRTELPLVEERRYHRANEWAKGVAPDREVISAGDSRHSAVRNRYPTRPLLPDLVKGVLYDWASGRIVRRQRPLDDVEIMQNILHGYPPGSDEALAELLLLFDDDPSMRPIASYFSHLYADLTAKVFAGVTLYEAWYSGEIIDVPDVDAIPFAIQILKTRAFQSPIPKGPKRTALYGKIRDQAFAYRKYRTLREAAAAAFLHARPEMDPLYAQLVPRFHYLFVVNGDEPKAIAALLHGMRDREALVADVDGRLKGSSVEFEKRMARQRHLENMHAWLRYWAQLAVFEQSRRRPPT